MEEVHKNAGNLVSHTLAGTTQGKPSTGPCLTSDWSKTTARDF